MSTETITAIGFFGLMALCLIVTLIVTLVHEREKTRRAGAEEQQIMTNLAGQADRMERRAENLESILVEPPGGVRRQR